jgi:hypothetical protein
MKALLTITALLLLWWTANPTFAGLVNKYRLTDGDRNWANVQWSLNPDGTGTTDTPTASD